MLLGPSNPWYPDGSYQQHKLQPSQGAIPPIMHHLSHWSFQPKPVSSVHNSTVCSMMILTQLEKSRQTQAFGKSRLTFRSPRKELVTKTTNHSSLISSPKNQPVTSLPPHGRDIPQALQDLSQLLLDVPTMEEDHQPEEPSIPPPEEPTNQIDNLAAQDPVQAQVDDHQPEGPSNDPPVIIMPSGYTPTSTKSTDRPGLLMQLTTAKPWPKLVSSLSSTSTHLPAFEHLHPPSHNLMGIPMQCHLMWQCNNKTRINLLMPWHRS